MVVATPFRRASPRRRFPAAQRIEGVSVARKHVDTTRIIPPVCHDPNPVLCVKGFQSTRRCLRNSRGKKSRGQKARNGCCVEGLAMFNKLTRSLNLALLGRASSFSKK